MTTTMFTIGYSNHSLERFLALLEQHHITALADVRSAPYSRFNPQFNRESLSAALFDQSIRYVFLGEELGARTRDRSCYDSGRVSYQKLAATALFQRGLDRLQAGAVGFRIALMCAEKDPIECHRAILVGRELERRDVEVNHILENGVIERHADTMHRLIEQLNLQESDFFRDDAQLMNDAYESQAARIAYVEEWGDRSRAESGR